MNARLLLLPGLAAATYYGSYNNNVQKMLDGAYAPRTSVFTTKSFTTDDLKEHWRLSNATGKDVDGMLEFAADAWPQNTSAPFVYGTLWFDTKLPLDGIVVECIHFQSRPGLYVTANLYRPAEVSERLPAVLYVCGQ